MEGYYPIRAYCELAKVSKDTAYHRAIRKEVPSFKDEEGKLFIYYSDYTVPDGFVTLKEYAAEHNTKANTVRQYIRLGNYKAEDVFRMPEEITTPSHRCIYIKKDAEICKKVDLNCPPGHLNAMEWCAKYNVSRPNLSQKILHGKIKPVKVGRYIYLEDREY